MPSDAVAMMLAERKRRTLEVAAFWDDVMRECDRDQSMTMVYACYKKWCVYRDIEPLGSDDFERRLRRMPLVPVVFYTGGSYDVNDAGGRTQVLGWRVTLPRPPKVV
jgi:phage/plasmid-associated DNA primase